MRAFIFACLVAAALPAVAQTRAVPEHKLIKTLPAGVDEEMPVAQPTIKLPPNSLLKCPDGKGGIVLQDTPCKAVGTGAAAPAGSIGTLTLPAGPASSAPEVTDLATLAARPVEAEAPKAVAEEGLTKWQKGALYGAGKLAVLLAAIYALFRLGLWARDRWFPSVQPIEERRRVARRVH